MTKQDYLFAVVPVAAVPVAAVPVAVVTCFVRRGHAALDYRFFEAKHFEFVFPIERTLMPKMSRIPAKLTAGPRLLSGSSANRAGYAPTLKSGLEF